MVDGRIEAPQLFTSATELRGTLRVRERRSRLSVLNHNRCAAGRDPSDRNTRSTIRMLMVILMTSKFPRQGRTVMFKFLAGPVSCVCLGLLLTSSTLRAQGPKGAGAAVTPAWGEMVLPGGGPSLLESVGVEGSGEDWRSLPVLIELAFGAPHGLRYTRNIEAYAATLQRFRRQAASIAPDGMLSLSMPAADKRRGDFEDFLETLGLSFDRRRRQVKLRTGDNDVARAATLKKAGVQLDGIVDRLNSGASVTLSTKDTLVPLPLGAAFWTGRFDPTPPAADLLWAILASYETSALYYGLLSLDGPTLTAVGADPKLATALIRRAAAFPVAAPALHIEGGRIVPAGGPAAGVLWEDLVDQPLTKPADFVDDLLGADDGRLAYFYSTVAAVPQGAQTFLLGGPELAAGLRRERFRRLYDAFRSALGDWRPDALMALPATGPGDVLFAVATRPDGTLAGPPWRDFWRKAFDSGDWPTDPVRALGKVDARRLMEPADVLAAICPDVCREERLGAFTLVQREFPDPTVQTGPWLLGVARTRLRYPALALTVERMQLRDAAAYNVLGKLAFALEQLPQPSQALTVVQFQAAVSLLARLRITGVSATVIGEHITALASLPLTGGFNGGLVRWLTSRVMVTAEGEDVDDVAIRALSGLGRNRESPVVEWESVPYRLDPAATEEARIRAVRQKFSTNSLATAQELLRIADGLAEAVKAGRLDALMQPLQAIVAQATDVGPVWWTGESFTAETLRDLPRETASALRKVRPTDRRRIERSIQAVSFAADIVAADALVSLVYAVAIEDPENPLALSAALPRRHELYGVGPAEKTTSPWMLPVERTVEGKARHAAGSLLALDVGVTTLTVRSMGSTRPEQEPNMSWMLAGRLQRTVALTKIWRMSDAEQQAIQSARKRGAAEVERWIASRRADRPLTDAGIAGPRAGWIRWALVRGTFDPAALLRGEDLVRLGGFAARPDAGAGAAMEPSRCLCVSLPAVSWELRGQPRDPAAAAAGLVEPMLRVLHELAERRLPVGLAPGLLAMFTTDLIEQSRLPHPGDMHAILASVRNMPSVRFDDYIAALAARGPLVRAAGSQGGSAQ